jgi:putative sterol carrier protein
MARFLTSEWVEEWNAALASLPPADGGSEGGPLPPDGPVTVVQEVHGTPDGDVRLVMRIDAGAVSLALAGDDGTEGGGGPSSDVTIVLAYDAAAAMSRGDLSPSEALTAGRIRVRGDLSVLAATQRLLNDVRSSSGDNIPATTY